MDTFINLVEKPSTVDYLFSKISKYGYEEKKKSYFDLFKKFRELLLKLLPNKQNKNGMTTSWKYKTL